MAGRAVSGGGIMSFFLSFFLSHFFGSSHSVSKEGIIVFQTAATGPQRSTTTTTATTLLYSTLNKHYQWTQKKFSFHMQERERRPVKIPKCSCTHTFLNISQYVEISERISMTIKTKQKRNNWLSHPSTPLQKPVWFRKLNSLVSLYRPSVRLSVRLNFQLIIIFETRISLGILSNNGRTGRSSGLLTARSLCAHTHTHCVSTKNSFNLIF